MRYGPDNPKVQETLTIIRQLNANPSLPNMKSYLQNVDVLDSDAHETLRQIFEDVSTMTEEELDIFAAALDAESINGLDDMLLIEQSLDAYTFWPDVTTDRELGAYLVESNYVWASPDIAPYVDYAMLGASYYAAHGGAYGPKGYAQRTGVIDPVFKAVIRSNDTEEPAIAFLPLHAKQVGKITGQLSVREVSETYVEELRCAKPERQELEQMPYMEGPSLQEANSLAHKLNAMRKTDGEYLKFLAALEAEQISTFAGALAVAHDLDSYTRFTGDLEDYGRDVLSRMGTPQQAIDSIEGYMDMEDFGRVMMAEDDVRKTQYGLIRKDWGNDFPRQRQALEIGGIT